MLIFAFTSALLLFSSFVVSQQIASFPPDFQFGIATAPAHVEDHLNDSWLQFARDGNVPFFKDIPKAEERLRFWSQPEVERGWMKELGVKMVRLGLDWGRLMPNEPGTNNCYANGYVHPDNGQNGEMIFACRNGIQDQEAMNHYLKMFQDFRDQGFFLSLTLFHHSLPLWANDPAFYGWTNPKLIPYFVSYVKDVADQVQHMVDQYIVFNEPAVFANLVYTSGMWPGAKNGSNFLSLFETPFSKGDTVKAFDNMAEAHRLSYYWIKKIDQVKADTYEPEKEPKWLGNQTAVISIAQNVGYHVATSVLTKMVAKTTNWKLNLQMMDLVASNIDFIGVNYYGKEFITRGGTGILDKEEYSESGRAISPFGFYVMLKVMNKRYNEKMNRTLPIVITENGISDQTDVLRPAYFIEHLLVISKLREEGVPVEGYYFWTLSDNWEWADGYCPHFGLLDVDRADENMKRTPRPSFYLYQKLIQTRQITQDQRLQAWNNVTNPPTPQRPFCKNPDGSKTVSVISYRDFAKSDWRFDDQLNLFPANWSQNVYREEPLIGNHTEGEWLWDSANPKMINVEKEVDSLSAGKLELLN